ncbi:MAG: hypothetical protein JW735_14310 [Prolixibacteraceae bacterium]|nr:hypothetical protein [Prolixibacteraceae bacterium]
MQKNTFFILVLIVFISSACSKKFLNEREPNHIETSADTIYISAVPNNDSVLNIYLPSAINANFQVYYYPLYLEFNSMTGEFIDGKAQLKYKSADNIAYYADVLSSEALLTLDVEGFGLATYIIAFEKKNNFVSIDFGVSELTFDDYDSVYVSFCNNSQTESWWSAYSNAYWLSIVSASSGLIKQGACDSMLLVVYRNNLDVGAHTGNLSFSLSGDLVFQHNISVKMEVVDLLANPEEYNLQILEGLVLDAHFFKQTNQLLLLTTSPNLLQLIDLETGKTSKLNLSKKPFSFSVSENEKEVMIASSFALMQHVDLASFEVIAEFELPFIPFDVEFGENGWCYASAIGYSSISNYVSVDLATGDIIRKENEYWMPEKALLKKIPFDNQMLMIPTFHNPSRPAIATITSGSSLNFVHEYTFFDTSYNLWLIKDGSVGISRNSNIYTLDFNKPENQQMELYAYLPQSHNWKEINFVSEDFYGEKVAICYSEYDYEYNTSLVSIVETEGFNETQVLNSTTLNNKGQKIRYAFINSKDKKLYMLVHAVERYTEDDGLWYIETKDIN